jgi:hypothetical protein
MLMLSRLITLLAPIDCITCISVLRAFLTSEDSLRKLKQAFMTGSALHESLGDELVAVLWWPLAQGYFLLLESMRMRRISLVTFHAEGEIVALCAVEAIHLLRDWLHALVTAEPKIVAILDKLLLGSLLSLHYD